MWVKKQYITLFLNLKVISKNKTLQICIDLSAKIYECHNRQSKLMEFALVQDNSSYLDALKSASGYLETASDDLQTIRVDLETKLERAHKDREIQLEIREKKMNDQQKHFEKLRDATETERVTLLELVKTLEIKLNSVTQVYGRIPFRCFNSLI